jgi:glycosyltransferase involved in cell wall biosynthesis
MAVVVPATELRGGVRTHRPLRIAMVAPPWFEVPPLGYGGTESIVADLVNQMVDRGHEVTLIGSGRDRTAAQHFIQVFSTPPTEHLGNALPEVINAAAACAALAELTVDVIHDHSLAGPLLAVGRATPTVATMHGPVTGFYAEYYRRLGDAIDLVAISNAQRRTNPDLNWIGMVYNAVDVSSFPFRECKDEYFLWLGRFNDEKSPHLAIDAARAAGRPIVLAGKLNEPDEYAYFEREIAPRLGPDIDYVGEADATLKRRLLSGARALLFPIQWEEPFGIVMVEAMACGTPVVAMRRGSVEEVIVDGVTGLIADDYLGFVEAVDASAGIDPADCRRHAEAKFDLSVMAAGYEKVYRSLLAGRGVPPAFGGRAAAATRR